MCAVSQSDLHEAMGYQGWSRSGLFRALTSSPLDAFWRKLEHKLRPRPRWATSLPDLANALALNEPKAT